MRLFFLFVTITIFSACEGTAEFCAEDCSGSTITVDTSKANRKVLVIGVDGVRSDALSSTTTPFLWKFRDNLHTYSTHKHIVEHLTFSGPNWSSICTGVHWMKHNVTDNEFSNNQFNNYPHFFEYIEQVYPHLNTVSIANWLSLNENFAKEYADYAPVDTIKDLQVFESAITALTQHEPISPDVLFLHFDGPDHAGHTYGFSPDIPQYTATLKIIDDYIFSLVGTIGAKRLAGEEWLILIVSDHGGDGKGHGGGRYNDDINKTIFYANSPEVKFVKNYITSQVDVVPTIFNYMGIKSCEYNCKTDGRSIIESQ